MQMTLEQALAALAQANAKVEAMQKATQAKLTCKVTEKGGLSVYGLGRFPVTLYAGQWERLLGFADGIKDFIAANEANLSRKD